uniref:Uncharacterized protein n=1 Tax=Megaviridae environmental sample TaxID=1737588 RepID=A0A5J6VJI2_9VIRU|nr:MAG: hypothetical protein [Megaviridae environmental sample]
MYDTRQKYMYNKSYECDKLMILFYIYSNDYK